MGARRETTATPILPGATLGVLGSGQLGRMFALAAREMGYRVHTYSDSTDSPAGHVADQEFVGSYEDVDRMREFARTVDVVTFEFENISAEAARTIEEAGPVRPGGHVLHVSQHRLREKSTLAEAGLPVTPFHPVRTDEELNLALQTWGTPGILKTAQGGYDGKGQVRVNSPEAGLEAWESLGRRESIYEQLVEFEHEVSVVAARGINGEFAACGPLHNSHRHHILDLTVYPQAEVMSCQAEALEIARGVLEHIDVVGVMCVEMFLTSAGKLLINEVAPRPHNSGHLTIEASSCCQFEQQVRAICGLPLGDMQPLIPAAMANLLGEAWSAGQPRWVEALKIPGVRLHLYGKQIPRPGRKMGHLTAVHPDVSQAVAHVLAARRALTTEPGSESASEA